MRVTNNTAHDSMYAASLWYYNLPGSTIDADLPGKLINTCEKHHMCLFKHKQLLPWTLVFDARGLNKEASSTRICSVDYIQA